MVTAVRPSRPPSRWDDGTCGVAGCPCHHDPVWNPTRKRCDHGFTDPPPGATTPGVHGATYIPGSQSPDAVALCATCKDHAQRVREART